MSAVLKISTPSFRPMTEADLSVIMEIENCAYSHPWTTAIFQDCLRVGYCCWVLELDEAITGYCVMSVGAGECHLLNLCIVPELQNNSYGALLLDHMLEIARSHHVDTAFLEVRPSNKYAIKLYFRAGFDEVGMRRDYYPAHFGREDALILARSLL
ncbi:MAG: ribosomal-protein-alanine N-acetyltransferase [Gammaproteobacteria bacterium RIFCSPLOWO2_12_47_11]|nr:MAG: ribosomal-protein-alanine N-acetyltransferase [Gammaproteobacteria bacterium RIFCSPLOWO2_12_47_11]